MTNINNHEVSMNKINLAEDIQELTCEEAAAIHGSATIQVFTGKNFTGRSTLINNLSGEFAYFPLTGRRSYLNNRISSAIALAGVWDLRSGRFGGGPGVRLRPGRYPRFSRHFNNTASSVISLG